MSSSNGNAPKFFIGDGRHRHSGASLAGVKTLRCDVIEPDGSIALRVIPTADLAPDPDVQLDFTFNEKRAAAIGQDFRDDLVGVLAVWRVDSGMTKEQKATIKLGRDQQRRTVSAIEHFLIRVEQGEPAATEIVEIVEAAGAKVGRRNMHNHTMIHGTRNLDRIYAELGPEGLRRTFDFNATWIGEPGTNTAEWLAALSLLVRDGYDANMTPSSVERMQTVVPAKELRRAKGEVSHSGASGTHAGGVAYQLARNLRKRMRMRARPAATRTITDKSGNSRRTPPARSLA